MVKSRSTIAIPPGETIKEQLLDRGVSQKAFAAQMELSEKQIDRLLSGEVQLTQEIADQLETVLGVPARFWCRLEEIYREKLTKVQAENEMDAVSESARKVSYKETMGQIRP